MKSPLLVAITGFALSGKSAVSRRISQELGYYHQDIDKLQIDVFGWEGHPRPDPTLIDLAPLLEKLRKEHRASSYMLFAMAEAFLEEGQSIIISALSIAEKENQARLKDIVAKTKADLKLIRCVLSTAEREEIERRIAADPFGVGYNVRLASTYEQYLFGLGQYEERCREFLVPCYTLDTIKPLEGCVAEAIAYIRSA